MTAPAQDRAAYDALADRLAQAGHVRPGRTPGVTAYGAGFEAVVAGLVAAMRGLGDAGSAERLSFAPVTVQPVTERTDYLAGFPQLVGAVRVFDGDDRAHRALLKVAEQGDDWPAELGPSGLTLVSAACHPVYGWLAGAELAAPQRYDLVGQCFRHEPSPDPARLTSFRMHEQVYLGTEQGALEHRDRWLELVAGLLADLGLRVRTVVAHDPFFGRGGRMLASGQQSELLKYEIVAPITGDVLPDDTGDDIGSGTAIASGNAHRDHFGVNFAISLADGSVAHSACFGLGLERTALALLAEHGMTIADWPAGVRERLGL